MTVYRIEPFSRGKGRVTVYLDDGFSFVLYKGELSQYDLFEGKELNEEDYNRILLEVIIPRAKKRGMNLLQKMDRTEADVRGKLAEGGYPIEAIDASIAYLKSFHYIDDLRYAEDYIRFKSNNKSRKAIIQKLNEKGIAKNIIDEAINNFYEEEGQELELIRKLMLKKCKDNISALEYSEKQKLFSYLYQKGFSIYDIEKVYNQCQSN